MTDIRQKAYAPVRKLQKFHAHFKNNIWRISKELELLDMYFE